MALPKSSPFFLLCLLLLLKQSDSKCQKPFQCGNLTMEFPFSHIDNPGSGCGLITVDGCGSGAPKFLRRDGIFNFSILNIIPPNKLRIRDPGLEGQLSETTCVFLTNVSLPQSPSISFAFSGPYITFFTCFNTTPNSAIESRFGRYIRTQCGARSYYSEAVGSDVPSSEEVGSIGDLGCAMAQLPVRPDGEGGDLLEMLAPEFTLEWRVSEECSECFERGGQCLSDGRNEFRCKGTSNCDLIIRKQYK